MEQVVATLVEWLRAPEQARLRRAFATWLRQVLLPARLPGVRLDAVRELSEVRDMLAERVRRGDSERLLVWSERVLDAGSLAAVFGD